MAPSDLESAQTEHQHHRYVGNQIPWYVHVLWLLFWIFAIYYVLRYLFTAIQRELLFPS